MLQERSAQLLLTAFFSVCILVSSVWAYGDHYAMGATGDDSPGYIYLASLMAHGQPLLWNDVIGKTALDFFGDYRYATWVLPTHHEFIHPDGITASKYPLGASLLLAFGALVSVQFGDGSVLGMYLVQPILGGVIVLLTYLLSVVSSPRWSLARHGIGLSAAALLALTDIFYETVISYPMRELPSMLFLLLAAVLFVPLIQRIADQQKLTLWQRCGLFVFGGLFGFACTVRETSIVILPGFIAYAVMLTWRGGVSRKYIQEYCKKQWQTVAIVFCGFLIGIVPIIWNAVQISVNNEPFKSRDTSSVVVLSNINHLQTVSLKNVFESTGRYRPANGSLGHYWIVLSDVTSIPFLPILTIVFAISLFWFGDRSLRAIATFYLLWFLGTLTMFSLWINPYSRYILPLLPMFFLLGAAGFVALLKGIFKTTHQYSQTTLFILSFLVIVGALIEPLRLMKIDHLVDEYPSRTMTRQDAVLLQDMKQAIITESAAKTKEENKTIVFFTGPNRFGLSEVFMAHTGLRAARLPYEIEKDQPDPETVDAFLRQLLDQGYSLYVVTPSGLSPELVEFEKRWNQQGSITSVLVKERPDIDFSFAQDSELKKLQHN